ncbi:MAG: CDP-alcohol phosphatidyltransferase family protein [Burkholderiaceae bacterium]|nr:MAG: CDP-alcohol phosphatidyltransferase family protein [Burkholderiaceae bacterium]TBR75647.1 MAG: CDP-alcohol phosphatidyltransferase family protein [Burkholderiaceae bacterium]
MLDRYATALIKPAVNGVARRLARTGFKADQVTWAGFGVGFIAFFLIANSLYWAGASAIILSRILDALDGAVARESQPTDRGGFLDIALDFLFYASIPLAFALADPARNALAAAVLLAAFMGTSTIFLAFAVLAAKRGLHSATYPDKAFYFLGGLTEATETLTCFIAMCLWPQHFAVLAYIFSALCAATIATRLWWGWHTFS